MFTDMGFRQDKPGGTVVRDFDGTLMTVRVYYEWGNNEAPSEGIFVEMKIDGVVENCNVVWGARRAFTAEFLRDKMVEHLESMRDRTRDSLRTMLARYEKLERVII